MFALRQSALEDRAAPLAFLYLLHPHPATSTAAHRMLCALLTVVPEERRPALALYYTERALEGCPHAPVMEHLSEVSSRAARLESTIDVAAPPCHV
jgi:hypothetical protein